MYWKSALSIPYSPLTDCYLYTSANEEWACNRVCLMVSFPCLHWWIATSTHLQMKNEHVTVYALWFSFIVSFDGLLLLHFCKWRMTGSRVCLMVFPHCLLWWIATFTLLQMENGQWIVYALWLSFTVSFDGLLLLHFYKWRMGSEPYMPYGFPSLSPLTDCYFYTSANGEWACNRVCLMVFLHCLH